MINDSMRWRRIEQEGAEWEVRVTAGAQQSDPHESTDEEMLEFICMDGTRKVRRLAVAAGAVSSMDETALTRAFREARPIGGDHYGRPGKRMDDAR